MRKQSSQTKNTHGRGDDEKNRTYAESRELEPEDEYGLESVIPGNIVEHQSQCDTLGESEEPKDDPVSQPLDIIIASGRLDSLDRKISRKQPSNEIGNGWGESVDGVENSKEDDTTNECVTLWNLSTLFEIVEDGILGELCNERGRVSQQGGIVVRHLIMSKRTSLSSWLT